MSKNELAVIYKIVKKDVEPNDPNIYIGSTSNIIKRRYDHIECSKNETHPKYNRKVYQYIRENGGWTLWKFEILEQCNCKSKTELLAREQYHIDLLKPTLNVNNAKLSKKEYYERHKDERLEKNKVICTCECGESYTFTNKARHEKSATHIQKLAGTFANAPNRSDIIVCECGESYTYGNILRHKKSIVHITKMNGTFAEPVKFIANEVVNCACGQCYTKNNKTRHINSKFHIKNTV